MQSNMKTLKICLVTLCLLPFWAVGLPQFDGANFFMKTITINSPKHGKHIVLIDDEDYEFINSMTWHINKHKGKVYAITTKNHSEKYKMHRIILGVTEPNVLVDHKDGNGLNNQRCNIRICTKSQNAANKKPKNKYLGVRFHVSRKKYISKKTGELKLMNDKGGWVAHITKNGVCKNLGRFKTQEQAAKAYNEAALKYHGEFALLNQIPNG